MSVKLWCEEVRSTQLVNMSWWSIAVISPASPPPPPSLHGSESVMLRSALISAITRILQNTTADPQTDYNRWNMPQFWCSNTVWHLVFLLLIESQQELIQDRCWFKTIGAWSIISTDPKQVLHNIISLEISNYTWKVLYMCSIWMLCFWMQHCYC